MKWLKGLIGGRGYGLSAVNPVQCGGGPQGEREYLEKLRCPNKQEVKYKRSGSTFLRGSKPIDVYDVECQCGRHRITVYMDMYIEGKDRRIDAEEWSLEECGNIERIVSDRTPANSASNHAGENVSRKFLEKAKGHPELVDFIENRLKQFGDHPTPKIIQWILTDGLTGEAQTVGSILLSYIGEPTIPHLIELLGHDNDRLAMFAAKTLSAIEGSLPYVKKALKSDDPKTRLHAAGALQGFGYEAIEAIPDLCDLITFEIIDHGNIEPKTIPEAAGIAAGALGRLGEAALPMVRELLNTDDANIRLVAVSALLRIGKPALPLLIEAQSKEKDQLVFRALQDTINNIRRVE